MSKYLTDGVFALLKILLITNSHKHILFTQPTILIRIRFLFSLLASRLSLAIQMS